MKKRIITVLIIVPLIAAVLLLFYLNNTPDPAAQDKALSIEVIVKSTDFSGFPFWNVVRQGVLTAAEEFKVKTAIHGPFAETEIDRQIEMIREAASRKPDALVIAAADYTRLAPIAEELKKAGIPIITIDSFIDSTVPLSRIGTDNFAAGEKAGQALTEKIDAGGEVAVISYVKDTSSQIDRERGVRSVLEKSFTIVGTWYCRGDMEIAKQQTAEVLEAYPNLKGIVALNEQSTVGAADALAEISGHAPVTLVGFDNSAQVIQYLEQEIISATVVQKPFNMGYLGIKLAVEAVQGNKIEPVIDTGSITITKENMYTSENQKLLFPVQQE